MFNTTLIIENGELQVSLEGSLDTMTAPGFDEELQEKIVNANKLIIDFANLDYISSAGLRTLLAAQQYMEDNGLPDVKVININDDVRETFELTGFDNMLDIE